MLVQGWRRVDHEQLCRLLEDSPLRHLAPADADADQVFTMYNTVLREIANQVAALRRIRRRTGRSTPWFDDDCHAQRHDCRRLKRCYCKSRCRHDRHRWVDAVRQRFRMYCAKKEEHWHSLTTSLPVRHTQLSTFGDQAFPVTAATTQNDLLHLIASASSLPVFQSGLKMHLLRNFSITFAEFL